MKTEDEIILEALEREHARLVKIADNARAAVDDHIDAPLKIYAIAQEKNEIYCSKKYDDETLARLDECNMRLKEAERLSKKDLLKLVDRQCAAERDRDLVASVIARRRFFLELKQHDRVKEAADV